MHMKSKNMKENIRTRFTDKLNLKTFHFYNAIEKVQISALNYKITTGHPPLFKSYKLVNNRHPGAALTKLISNL